MSALADTDGVRSVVRIDGTGGPVVVAKLYADHTGAATFRTQRALARQVPRDSLLAIPRPLFYDWASRTLVQEYVGGGDLAARVAAGGEDRLERAGRAVAELHAMDLPDLVDQSLANHLTTLIRPHPQALASARPELGRRIGSLLAALEAIAPAKGSFRAAIHRDLHLRQMLADDERIWIVDWDLAGVGDPAIDIGNLDVWLETHLARDLASRCRDRFLTGYVDVAGHDAVRRAGTYRGFAYLRLACKRFRLGEDVETRVRPMIEGAEAALGSSC